MRRAALAALAVVACLAAGAALPVSSARAEPVSPPAATLDEASSLLAGGRYEALFDTLDRVVAEAGPDARDVQSGASTLRALALADLGRLEEAWEESDAALHLLVGTPHVDRLVDHLVARSDIARALGRADEAAESLREAGRWLETLGGDGRGLALRLSRTRLALSGGRIDEASAAVEAARRFCRASREPGCRAHVALAEGRVALARGELKTALRRFLKADADFEQAGSARHRVAALRSLAEVYAALEWPDRAAAAVAVGLDVASRIGHERGRADLERRSGELALARGDRVAAERHLEAARHIYRSMRALPDLAASRLVLARLAREDGRLAEARVHLRAARRMAEASGDAAMQTQALRALARAARAAGDGAEEARWLEALLDGRPGADWRVAARLGALALARGDADEAVRRLLRAVDAAEALDPLHARRGERDALREDRLEAYDRLVAAWLADPVEPEDVLGALAASERALATGYRDLLERAHLRRAEPAVRDLLEALDAVDARTEALARAAAPDGDAARALIRLGRERAALEARIRDLEPALRVEASGRLVRRVTEAVETVRRRVDAPVAVLEYHLGPTASHLFVIRRGRVDAVALPDGETLGALATAFHESLERPARTTEEAAERRRLARTLHRHLLAPAEPLLEGRTRVVVIPHGALRLVPFGALMPDGESFALERFAFTYAPSLAAIAEINRQAGERRLHRMPRHALAAFGDPVYAADAPIALKRLAGTAREVEQARRHLGADPAPGTLFLREAATEAALKRLALHRYRVVHLATHGYAGDTVEAGRLPALFLGPGGGEDGVLGIDEVVDLRLDADLVVLSACDSGRGPLRPGDGLGGLTGAFLQAGASAVLATLWAVEDAHAARMMDVFYRRLSEGASQAEALRGARLGLLAEAPEVGGVRRGIGGILDPSEPPPARARTPKPPAPRTDPFFWASFVLVGDVGDILR